MVPLHCKLKVICLLWNPHNFQKVNLLLLHPHILLLIVHFLQYQKKVLLALFELVSQNTEMNGEFEAFARSVYSRVVGRSQFGDPTEDGQSSKMNLTELDTM